MPYADPARRLAYIRHLRATRREELNAINRATYAANRRRYIDYGLKWQAKNPARAALIKRASNTVLSAIRTGRLTRPTVCEQCGRDDKPIEAAHYDYTQPLHVRWLCRPCHRHWDSQEPKSL